MIGPKLKSLPVPKMQEMHLFPKLAEIPSCLVSSDCFKKKLDRTSSISFPKAEITSNKRAARSVSGRERPRPLQLKKMQKILAQAGIGVHITKKEAAYIQYFSGKDPQEKLPRKKFSFLRWDKKESLPPFQGMIFNKTGRGTDPQRGSKPKTKSIKCGVTVPVDTEHVEKNLCMVAIWPTNDPSRELEWKSYEATKGLKTILQPIGFCEAQGKKGSNKSYLLFPFYNGPDLYACLEPGVNLKEADRYKIVQALAEGVFALHSRGIVHADLKPENVFISRKTDGSITDVVIGDLPCFSDETTPMVSLKCTAKYAPIEYHRFSAGQQEFPQGDLQELVTFAWDIWALGCLFCEVYLQKRLPWATVSLFGEPRQIENFVDSMCFNVAQGGHPFGTLISEMLSFKPNERPSAKEVMDRVNKLSPKEMFSLTEKAQKWKNYSS